MKKIEEMISRLCPEGVKRVRIEDVCVCLTGGDAPEDCIKGQKEPTEEYPYPVYANGDNIYGYATHYRIDKPAVTISSIGNVGTVFLRKAYFIPIIRLKTFIPKDESINVNFLYYCLSSMSFVGTNSSLSSMKAADFKRREIPLPHPDIQKEIVRILDNFTSLQENLEEELKLRQKQYEYYCDQFFGGDIEGMKALDKQNGTKVIPISELGEITRGKRFVRDDVRENGQPCIHYGDMYTFYGVKASQTKTFLDRDFPKKMRYAKKGDVIIVGAGENDLDIGVGLVWFGEEPAAVHDACYILEHNINPMYISYYLRSSVYHLQLRQYVSEGKICSFSGKDLGRVLIPVPILDKQQEIVNTLDKFEAMIANVKEEIELRKKQYEYYREKLLTF